MKLLKLTPILLSIFLLFSQCGGDLNDLNSMSSIDNIVGTWHAVMNYGDGTADYQVEIIKSQQTDSLIYIANFFNNGDSAYAYVRNLDITLPNQTVNDEQISGYGVIADDYQRISWNVNTSDGTVTIEMTPGTVAKRLQISK